MFDPKIWAQVPFGFWTLTAFLMGCNVGSFLNVCIYRMPLGKSLVRPRSHCPHCGYSIPWHLNIPLVTWLWLGGKCANCQAPISPRYFFVELLTGVLFALAWIKFGHISAGLAIVQCVLLSGFIVATFIDIEHLIIPDQITFGGMVAGLFCSLLVPQLHIKLPELTRLTTVGAGLLDSFIGLVVGAGLIYGILRGGKFFLGRHKLTLPPSSRILFDENCVKLPTEDIAYEELFYRKNDAVEVQAHRVELIDRCYGSAAVYLTADRLKIGEDSFDPEKIVYMELTADRIVIPREAMGPADVTFMAVIGAFLGWPAVFFSLALSSVIGTVVTGTLIVFKRHDWSSRIPYGPYLAAGAVLWMFGGYEWLRALLPTP